jgi:hypothetical protein
MREYTKKSEFTVLIKHLTKNTFSKNLITILILFNCFIALVYIA